MELSNSLAVATLVLTKSRCCSSRMNDLNRQFSIGGLTIDPLANTLKFNSHIEKLSPKVMEVFCTLFQGNGAVVTRDQLLDSVWADRFGGDESLSRAISELRKSLSRLLDTNKKIITTVPKRGYRLELSLLTAVSYTHLTLPTSR